MFYGQNQMEALGLKEHYFGDEAQQKRGLLSLQRPMEHGVVSDWEAMERVWQAAFSQLRVSAADQPVLMTEPLLNPMANRENMTQVGVAATATATERQQKPSERLAQAYNGTLALTQRDRQTDVETDIDTGR